MRYLPLTDTDREDMLARIGVSDVDALFSDVPAGKQVMLKLTLPTKPNLYKPLIGDPRVMRVVALSGGYSRDEANAKLKHNDGMIASFSRALAEGLSANQTDDQFNAALASSIDSIFDASSVKAA